MKWLMLTVSRISSGQYPHDWIRQRSERINLRNWDKSCTIPNRTRFESRDRFHTMWLHPIRFGECYNIYTTFFISTGNNGRPNFLFGIWLSYQQIHSWFIRHIIPVRTGTSVIRKTQNSCKILSPLPNREIDMNYN